ncbi:MAG: tRNA 2-thiouridine(34) synthase MnmA [Eubacteriales bacterium]|nr:tRNA 2-thiouridine(34) synthase MnmA [Eubacteriales bacterium]
MERIVVGMSGGVDSSVAALLLKQQGYDVVGVFMKNWDEKDENGVCTSTQDWQDVQDVCAVIDIPCYAVNFQKEYWDRVFSDFLSEYKKGRTPNPDVLCNREIKFKAFLDFALKLGAERMATGHFVRTETRDGHPVLLRGVDANKDQSYFLYMLKEHQLARAMFPVGGMTKAQVRAIAEENGLPVSRKKDSTGVCFIGERNFRQFLQNYLPLKAGDMRTEDGCKVGRHIGLAYYTLGQRKGLGIGGGGDGRSWFVVDKDLKNNVLVVAQGGDSPRLFTRYARASQITWVADHAPVPEGEPFRCMAKYRYRQPDQPVTAVVSGASLCLTADEPQRAVTPGQSVVLYQGDVCLGGSIIEETANEPYLCPVDRQ